MRDDIDIDDGEGIDLMIYWEILRKRIGFLFSFVFISVVLAIIYLYAAPNFYKSEAVILVSSESSYGGIAATLAQSTGLSSMAGDLGGGESTLQKIESMLNTGVLARDVIRENNLLPVLFDGKIPTVKSPNDDEDEMLLQLAVKKLLGSFVKFDKNKKNNLLTISAEFKDPVLAEKIVDSYIKKLQDFINNNSMTHAKRQKLYIEKQIKENKNDFLKASTELNNFSTGNKYRDFNPPIFGAQNFQGSKPSESADLNQLEQQKRELDEEMGRLESEGIPDSVYLQYLTSRMTLMTQLHFMLQQQYEISKIQEIKEQLDFQVLDPPRVPQFRSKPKRKIVLVSTFVVASFFAIFLIFCMEFIQNFKKRQQQK